MASGLCKEDIGLFCVLICWSYIDTLESGSPIIQDGKLIGAVTHVFINDCCRGYAGFAETMLKTAESAEQLADEKALKDAS